MMLDEAILLARRFHDGQVDKGGRPYIEHPLRVMNRVTSDDEKLAAIMHDLLEDTELSSTDLAVAGCPSRVLQALDALTRRSGETYDDFVKRAAEDRLARVVKLADIDDNLDPERLALLNPDEAARLREKYRRARAIVEGTEGRDPEPSNFVVGEPQRSSDFVYMGLDCDACGHPAGRVELQRDAVKSATGAPGSSLAAVVVTSLMGRFVSPVGPAQASEVADAVASLDAAALHRLDFAPFWCRGCEKPYCSRHWTTEVIMDEGFYDCTYGTCPLGHRSMIDD